MVCRDGLLGLGDGVRVVADQLVQHLLRVLAPSSRALMFAFASWVMRPKMLCFSAMSSAFLESGVDLRWIGSLDCAALRTPASAPLPELETTSSAAASAGGPAAPGAPAPEAATKTAASEAATA